MTDRLALARVRGARGGKIEEERRRRRRRRIDGVRDKLEQRGGRMKTILSNLRAVKSLSAGRGPEAH